MIARQPTRTDVEPRQQGARRFLWIFALVVLLAASSVGVINLVAYRYMLRDDNQAIVQLLSGWGRMYKPVLFDEIRPEIAVYGASWARDAFDPEAVRRQYGRKLFNHAVSGGTAYETRRFGDSSLDNPSLEVAIINLDTFYRNELVARFRYGFDESILDLDAERQPNRLVGLRRAYSLALTGWAAGANLELLGAVRARDAGASRAEYLEAYQRADLTRRQDVMDRLRQRMFEPGGAQSDWSGDESRWSGDAAPPDLDWMIDGFCSRGVDVIAYFTPAHSRQQQCDPQAVKKIAVLGFLREKQSSCDARIGYFDFDYPNAVTLDGVLRPVTASEYYRPDGHPRPTVGGLMFAGMFGLEFPAGTPDAVKLDFGVDLLSHPDAEGWIRERAARCTGEWRGQGRALLDALDVP